MSHFDEAADAVEQITGRWPPGMFQVAEAKDVAQIQATLAIAEVLGAFNEVMSAMAKAAGELQIEVYHLRKAAHPDYYED